MARARKKTKRKKTRKKRARKGAAPAPASTARDIVFVELAKEPTHEGGAEVWSGACMRLTDHIDAEVTSLGPGDALSVRDRFAELFPTGLIVTRDAPAARLALGPARAADVVDASNIARAALPELSSFEPDDLLRLALGEAAARQTGVLLTRELWQRLWDVLVSLPLAALTECMWLASLGNPGMSEIFRRAEAAARTRDGVDDRPFQRLFKDRGADARKRNERILGDVRPLSPDEVGAVLGAEGAVATRLDDYEDRPQQREMAEAVARAFSQGRHLLAEGGTGVGKSLAYLVPAVLWSARNGRPVVVSTHTKNLQSQLFEKDLPLLSQALDEDLKVAIIKGRRNYLCVRKLLALLRAADYELEFDERPAMIPVVTWAARTVTGDLSENVALQLGGVPSLFDKITSLGHECPGKRCNRYGSCFLQAMRAEALAANVIVANHALVFSELGNNSAVLPDYGEIVFDEAHHVEAIATEHLGVSAARIPMMRVLSRLFRVARRGPAAGSGTGLLATVFHEVGQAEGSLDPDFALQAHEATRSASEHVKVVSETIDEFFAAAAEIGPGRGTERRRRYYQDGRTSPAWQGVFERGKELTAALGELGNRIDRVADLLASKEAKPVGPRRELSMDLKSQCAQLEELVGNIGFVLAAESEGHVYWIEEDPSISRAGPFARLAAAPIEVAPLLKARLLDQNNSCIFTSATLTVGDSFDYLAGRLGLLLSTEEHPARSDATAVGSPFDYASQVRVLIPRFLPDPRNADVFTDELSDLCVDLFEASAGRGMVLFTSYSMLSHARDIVAPALAKSGIRVLAQGRDGSRESMLEELRANRGTVLLGTASFWEGIDVPGDALSVLVVAKLPFHVFTEPVIQARCEAIREAGGDPFNEYSLPAAVLRLRQGFGRLIRTGADRGVVVIADGRILKAGYGSAFLESLPVRAQAAPNARTLVNAARKFLEVDAP